MRRLVAAALIFGLSLPAHAVVLDDLLARGYTVAEATYVHGAWAGCVRQHRIVFGDGTVFACARTAAQTGFEPRVYVLRLGGGPPSVVLVGSAVLAGELLQLGLDPFAVPLRVDASPLPEAPANLPGALAPVGAIPSINLLNGQQHASLQQQHTLLPVAPRRRP